MSKTKSATKTGKASDKVLSKVKDAGVTKSSQSPKAKGKDIAKKLKEKEEKSSRKKKEPTPSSSESESDSDEEMESASSESESEDEKETKKPVKASKAVAKKDESSDSESESDESESEEEEKPKQVTKAKAESKKAKEESSDSESSESESEEEVKKTEKKVEKKAAASEESSEESESSEDEAPTKDAKKTAAEDSDDSESDSDDSESDSEDSEESKEAPKKRKAEEDPAPQAKKSKTESAADNSPNLFVGNLSWNVDEEWLRREFEEFGELNGVRIMTERETGRSRGFGYVEYADASSAKAAYEAKKDAEVDGRTINLDYAKPRDNTAAQAPRDRAQTRARSFGDQTSPESNTIFVGNLVFGVDENAVREIFEEKGQINGIRLPTDPESGRPKGYGYVEFASVDEARQALNELQGADIGGRPIRLDFSTPRAQGDNNRGGRGGFGGRGGGRGGPRGGGGRGRGGFGGGRGRGGATGANSTNRGGFGDFSGKKISFD